MHSLSHAHTGADVTTFKYEKLVFERTLMHSRRRAKGQLLPCGASSERADLRAVQWPEATL